MVFPIREIKDYFKNIISMNPYDDVIILKEKEHTYYVEMINAKSIIFSISSFFKGMEAQHFFKNVNWDELKQIIDTSHDTLQCIHTINQTSKMNVAVYHITNINNQHYIILIFRKVISLNTYQMSYKNEITGLINRSALNIRWADYYQNVTDHKNLAIMIIDLDRFKKYNESLGKKKADLMIKQASERLNQFHNENCELFHYSSDEFIFVIQYYLREEVEVIGNNILESFKSPFIIDEQEYFLTVSIGIATISSERQRNLETIMSQAEQALYYVKNHGRNHYRFYRNEMSHTFQNEVLMESHLRRAIELNELSIHLQPQVDFQSYEIDSFEALIRWNNPKFGHVPPSQFIPLAEASGIIIQIGDWVLEKVCQYQQEWKGKGYRQVRIAVNISPKQFKQDNFVLKIKKVLEKYEIDPKFIELEITESSMENAQQAELVLKKLKALGLYVSVDDFGTGYSSLSYLKKYPIDFIKIDQSFIADINKDEKNEAIIKAIITLSHNLGMDVIAEGVEEKNQETFLKQNRCKKGQGYLYNKPLPITDIIKRYFLL